MPRQPQNLKNLQNFLKFKNRHDVERELAENEDGNLAELMASMADRYSKIRQHGMMSIRFFQQFEKKN
jgi:hypothetical protein